MSPLFRKAILKADEVRMNLGLGMYEPVNIFDACIKLGLTLRFVDINMEGMYVKQPGGKNPTILISNQRPLPRRCFTCAHELGHHSFNHGTKLDVLADQDNHSSSYDSDELLVDTFAGALLMPVAGIHAEFAKRNWAPPKASAIQFYTLSSYFGTGYQTLITHSRANKIITEEKARELLKYTPAKILESIFRSGSNKSHFKIVDAHSKLSIIDLEVSNYIILPSDIQFEGNHLEEFQQTNIGKAFIALKPGVIRAAAPDNSISYFIRIQNYGYIGLAENRHLESEID
jgi:Zn-dependent peptidase ImmA (M78 family)